MTVKTSKLSLFVILVLLTVSCRDTRQPIQIGSHDFTEQKLLAEMMALLAEQQGVRVKRAIPYGSNRKNLEAIQRGVIDAYPEYDGTLLALSGGAAHTEEAPAADQVRSLIEPLGLRWLKPFGLDNRFALVVRRDVAFSHELVTISDLARLPESLQFGVDQGYLSRPVDGLYALARHYGLKVGDVAVLPIGERDKIYDALVDRQVDVAEVFTTDSRLNDYGVFVLQDDLGFYPAYRPAPLVRAGVLEQYPELKDAWGKIAGRIDTETMRRLNGRVERIGEDYRDVARRFLEQLELLPKRLASVVPVGRVTLAITPLADLSYISIRAAQAIREVMPARPLRVDRVAKPVEALRRGQARFGLVGAEEFYYFNAKGALIQTEDIEAVGVVGTRLAHVVRKAGAGGPATWQRVGVGAQGGSSWMVARMLRKAIGLDQQGELVAVLDPLERRKLLDKGDLDAMVVMAEQGNGALVSLLRAGDYELVSIEAFRGKSKALQYPFLRPARIPTNTYPGQTTAVDTVASQIVLATLLPPESDPIGESGPGYIPGVFTRLPGRLPGQTARQISKALDSKEHVDPALPRSPGLAPEAKPAETRIYAEPASALLNILAIAFLAYMVVLFLRKLPSQPDLASEEHSAEPGDGQAPD